jgi:hypothetical protein
MYLLHQACDKVLVLIKSLFWKTEIFLQELAALFEAEGAATSLRPVIQILSSPHFSPFTSLSYHKQFMITKFKGSSIVQYASRDM